MLRFSNEKETYICGIILVHLHCEIHHIHKNPCCSVRFVQTSNLGKCYKRIALKWLPQNLIHEKSTLVQVVVGAVTQAASPYLSQCWPRSVVPYSAIRSQWVNTLRPRQMDAILQKTCSSGFSWMQMFELRLKFHWSLFRRVQLTIIQHSFR